MYEGDWIVSSTTAYLKALLFAVKVFEGNWIVSSVTAYLKVLLFAVKVFEGNWIVSSITAYLKVLLFAVIVFEGDGVPPSTTADFNQSHRHCLFLTLLAAGRSAEDSTECRICELVFWVGGFWWGLGGSLFN